MLPSPKLRVRSITASPLRVFDLETTGLNTAEDRIVQFGTATFRNGALLRTQDILVNPCMPIPMDASNVHGIYDSDVEDAPTFGLMCDSVAHTVTQSEEQVLCGYNALRFDVPLLNAEFQRHCYSARIDPAKVLDPFVWLAYHRRDWPSRRLVVAAERFNCPLTEAHRASADAEATGYILNRMIEQGLIPDDVDEALEVQRRLLDALQQETDVYGRFLYNDRENQRLLRIGFGKHVGTLLREVPASYLRWMLKQIPDLPPLAAAEIRVYTD